MSVAEYEIYRRIKELGKGAFGTAYLVECLKDNTLCVIKQVNLNGIPESERKDTIKEARILEALKHPHIIRFREVYKTKKGKLCIVMDYADGGDLAKKVSEAKGSFLSESQILEWFTQICLALKHVHDRKIIHRDLKCQNIFLTKENSIKLGDFGIARILSNTKENVRTMVGTPYYLSPEIIDNKPYSFKSDIWSLGVILYELCALKPPFDAESLPKLALKICKGSYNPLPNHYSREIKQMVAMMLNVDPNRRPNVHDILSNSLSIGITIRAPSHDIQNKELSLRKYEDVGVLPHHPSQTGRPRQIIVNPQKFVDPTIKMDEIRQVLREEPMPADMLRYQVLREKEIHQNQLFRDKSEKDRLDKIEKLRLERERAEREKMEHDKREREKMELEARINKMKNLMLPEKEKSPMNRNAITPNGNQRTPMNNNNPFTPANNNLVRNKPQDMLPKSPNYLANVKKEENPIFNPFEKKDIKKYEIKPILYAPPNRHSANGNERRDISPLNNHYSPANRMNDYVANKANNIFENKNHYKEYNSDGNSKADERKHPSPSPRNVIIHHTPRDQQVENIPKPPEEDKNRKMVLREQILENRRQREKLKEKPENEEKKNQEIQRILKKQERDEERLKMREDIKEKIKMSFRGKKEIEVEVFIAKADYDSDDEDEKDERDKDELEQEPEKLKEEEVDEEQNLISMINDMQQIIEEVSIDQGHDPVFCENLVEAKPKEELVDVSHALRDISNIKNPKVSKECESATIGAYLDDKLGADVKKKVAEDVTKKIRRLIEDIDMKMEDHYSKIKEELLNNFSTDSVEPVLPFLILNAVSDI